MGSPGGVGGTPCAGVRRAVPARWRPARAGTPAGMATQMAALRDLTHYRLGSRIAVAAATIVIYGYDLGTPQRTRTGAP